MPHPARFLRPALLALALAGTVSPSPATEDVPGAAASQMRPRYPMLIRNPYAPLVRVAIDIGKRDPGDTFERYDLRLRSITFRLDGTDDLNDLQSLSLVTTGADDDLRVSRVHNGGLYAPKPVSEVTVLSGPQPAAREVTFKLDQRLEAGENYLWLSATIKPSANLTHRLAATCTGIGTNGGWLTATTERPLERQRIGIALRRDMDDGVDTFAIPSVDISRQGTLLCVYDMRWVYPGHDLQDWIDIGLSRSADHGQTWEPMRKIMDMGTYGGLPLNQNGCSDPGIIADRKTGEVFVFACWINGHPGHHQWVGDGAMPGYDIAQGVPQILMVRSTDDGRTWAKPENLTRTLKHPEWWLITTSPNHGIQMADGTLVMPMQGRDEQGKPFATVVTSADDGKTWHTGGIVKGGNECTVAELGDGSIMLNIRNSTQTAENYLHRLVYVSRDHGQTWKPHPTNGNTLVEPECNAGLLRADYQENGQTRHVLLFSNPHSDVHRVRINQTIQVSFDDGLTWPRENDCFLDEKLAWSYPSLIQIDPERIGIIYAGSQSGVVFQVIPLKDLLRR